MNEIITLHDGLMEVYDLPDGSWRVWFYHGSATKEGDVRIRNIPSKEAALAAAEAWWLEWEGRQA
jgi:hypothetical protein